MQKREFSNHKSETIAHYIIFIILLTALFTITYFRNMVWKSDVILWEDVIKKGTEKIRAHNNLGFAYSNQGWVDKTMQEYVLMASMLKINPVLIHNNLGTNYYRQGKFDEAIKEYLTALELNPYYPEVHNNLGVVYSVQGKFDEAIKEYQIALKINPNYADANYNLALAYKSKGI